MMVAFSFTVISSLCDGPARGLLVLLLPNVKIEREREERLGRRPKCLSAQCHPPAGPTTNRVILKLDGSEFEIGSIGIQHGAAWRCGIDTVISMRVFGDAREREGPQGLHAAVQGGLKGGLAAAGISWKHHERR